MINADVIGSRAVIALIEQSGHTKFIVKRAGDARNMPVIYEATHTKTNKDAAKDFATWSDALQYGNNKNTTLYEVMLFSNDAEADDDAPEVKTGQRKKMKFTFQFNTDAINNTMQPPAINGMQPADIQQQISVAVDLALTKREIDDLRAENEDLRAELEEIGGSQPLDQINDILDKFSGLSNKAKNQIKDAIPAEEMAAVAGVESATATEQTARIRAALQILARHSDDLAGDLERMANLAQNNTPYFNMVLNMLRNM